jgi:hypothetical protein
MILSRDWWGGYGMKGRDVEEEVRVVEGSMICYWGV